MDLITNLLTLIVHFFEAILNLAKAFIDAIIGLLHGLLGIFT